MSEEIVALHKPPAEAIWGNRPFMLLWSAQAISQTAQNAIWFALMVLIEETTRSTTQVGIAIVSFILPSVLFTVPAGVLVDRVDKRLVLVSTNWLRAMVVLGYILFRESPSTIYGVTFVFAIISQFFLPAEAAMIPALVGRRSLITANSLFNLTFTLSQLVGIVFMAPILIKLVGIHALFATVAVLFAVCGFLVLPLSGGRAPREPAQQDGRLVLERFTHDLREAWAFLQQDRAAAMAMVVLTSGATLTLITAMLAPRYVVAVVGIRADDTVYVLAPAGFGMALAAMVIGRLTRWVPKELLTVVGIGGVAVGLLMLAVVSPLWRLVFHGILALLVDPSSLPTIASLVSVVMLVAGVTGFAASMLIISSQTILQERAPPASRGRIFAVQIMLGNLASIVPLIGVGEIADRFGITRVMLLLALAMAGLGYWVWRSYRTRIWAGES